VEPVARNLALDPVYGQGYEGHLGHGGSGTPPAEVRGAQGGGRGDERACSRAR